MFFYFFQNLLQKGKQLQKMKANKYIICNILTDKMNIENYLSDDEEILSKVVSKDIGERKVHFYATNKRIIRHQKGLLSEKIDSLNYRHIISVSLESPSYIWIALLGIVFILLIPLGFSVGNDIFLFISGISFFIGPPSTYCWSNLYSYWKNMVPDNSTRS